MRETETKQWRTFSFTLRTCKWFLFRGGDAAPKWFLPSRSERGLPATAVGVAYGTSDPLRSRTRSQRSDEISSARKKLIHFLAEKTIYLARKWIYNPDVIEKGKPIVKRLPNWRTNAPVGDHKTNASNSNHFQRWLCFWAWISFYLETWVKADEERIIGGHFEDVLFRLNPVDIFVLADQFLLDHLTTHIQNFLTSRC